MKKTLLFGLAAGVIILLVSLLLNPILNIIFPDLAKEYANPGLFRPWGDPLMSLIFVYPFILGLFLSIIWNKTKQFFKGKNYLNKGLKFALVYWFLASFGGMFISYSTFPVSFTMILSWSLTGLIEVIAASLLLAKIST